jgi:DNA-binding GntR family transcriptional regulator
MARTQRVDEAYGELRSRIVKRTLLPGARLSGLSLSKSLNISRTPVREALRRLQAEGFVVFFPGRGFVVNSLSLDDVDKIYTIRIPLEGLAGRLATRDLAGDRDKMVFLEALIVEMEDLCGQGAAAAYADKNKEFHGAIFRACGNAWLINILENLTLQMGRFILNAAHIPGRMEKSMAGHREILERLRSADPNGVERAIAMHCRKASEDLMKEFKRAGDEPRPS